MSQERHHNQLAFKYLKIFAAIIVCLLLIGVAQDWLNTPGRFCHYNFLGSSKQYNVYDCRGETEFVPVNQ